MDEPVELARAADAQLEDRERPPVVATGLDLSGRDVDPGRGNGLGHRGQQARLVDATYFEPDGPRTVLPVLPYHRHSALRITHHRVRASLQMHRDAAPTCDEAD